MKQYPCSKGQWRIIGGDDVGNNRMTRIIGLCNCGCEGVIHKDNQGNCFISHLSIVEFIDWEQAKGRVNKLQI